MRESLVNRRDFLAATAGTVGACAVGTSVSASAAQTQSVPFSREIPLGEPRDLIVCGGGPAGIAAALAVARAGLKVLLIEGQGQLGGNGTSGLVSHWLRGRSSDGRQWVVGGIFREMSERAAGRGIALVPTPSADQKYQPHGWYRGQLATGIPLHPFGKRASFPKQDR